jgi:hypothetical protein
MAYCGPRGIELDAFLRWSEGSQRAALEWMKFEGRRCKSCGTHPDEWAEERYAYHAHLAQCKGCQHQQRLTESRDAQEAGRGVYAVMAYGPAAACPQCMPDDD